LDRKEVLSEDLQSFLPKISLVVDPELEAMGYQHVRTKVDVQLVNGKVLSQQADWAKGYPMNPLTKEELNNKSLDCVVPSLGEQNAQSAYSTIETFSKRNSVDVLRLFR